MNFQSVISRLRPPVPRASLKRDGMHLPAGAGRGRLDLVIARSLLRVRVITLSAGLSMPDRWSALRSQALAWQPFERCGLRFGLQPSGAGLAFAWDQDLLDRALDQAGMDPAQVRCLPEPALLAPPAESGVLLHHGLDGYEAQQWQEGELRASRWWPALPGQEAWQEFCHAAAVPMEQARPQPQSAVPATASWLMLRDPADSGTQQRRVEQMLVGGLGLALVAASVPVLHEHVALRLQLRGLDDRLIELRATAEPTLKLRESAIAMQQRGQLLVADLQAVQPLQVMQHLAEVLPKDGVTLKEFELDGLRLKLVFELVPGLSRGRLVESLQTGGWFAEVSEQAPLPQPNWVAYGVRLSGIAPPVAAKEAGS